MIFQKICIAGKNQIAINAVENLLKEHNIKNSNILGITNKTDNSIDNWQPSFKKYCIKNKIQLVNMEEIYNIENLLFISLEFDKIINPEKFRSNNFYNIHFSLLPKYKGMYTSIWPILNNEIYSGVTLHKIDKGIDTGDIIDQIKFKININDTSRDLYFKYLKYGEVLFTKNINKVLKNKYNSKVQSNKGTYYSKKSLDFSNIKIDLNKTSMQIHNQIRAFIFKEYQYPVINNKKIRVSYLTNEKIDYNYFFDTGKDFIISGIDGYKIIASYYD